MGIEVNKSIGKTFYCHGFGSCFDPHKDKVSVLSRLAPVVGKTVDYTDFPEKVFADFSRSIMEHDVSLIAGTSMGGFFAAWLGGELRIPFLAMNPATNPSTSLRKYVGHGQTYFGCSYLLLVDVVDAYAGLPFRLDGEGLVAVDLGDDIIDPHETLRLIEGHLPTVVFEGGSHRFDHVEDLLPMLGVD